MATKVKTLFPIFLLLTSILLVLRWFDGNELIISSDLTFPIKPIFYFNYKLLYQWLFGHNGGVSHAIAPSLVLFHGIPAFLNVFIKNVSHIQFIHYVIWLFLPMLTIYFLANYLFSEKKRKYLYIFLITLFYSFNLYRVIMFGDAASMSIYAAEPLILLFLIKALAERKNYFRYAFYIGLSSIIASGAGANPPMYIVFLIPPCIYITVIIVEYFFQKEVLKLYSTLKFIFITIIVMLLLNLYWLLPFLNQYINTVSAKGLNDASLLDWSLGVSGVTSITNIIRMQGAWDWYSGVGNDPYIPYAVNYQNNPILLLLGFSLPILAFLALYFEQSRYTLYFTLLTLVGIIFSQGAHSPFGPIYNFFTRYVPFFWMFRSSWYKFSFLVALGYSYLGAVSVSHIFAMLADKKTKFQSLKLAYSFIGLIVLGTLIYAYPFINGEKFPKRGTHKILPASHVEIPDYIYKATDWINSQKETFRLFVFPNLPSFIYTWEFNGLTDIIFYLFDKGELFTTSQIGTSMESQGIGNINSQIYNDIYYSNYDSAQRLLGILSSKYLVERADIRYNFYGGYDSPMFVNNQLKKIQTSHSVTDFGEWSFYRLSDKYFLPLFYVPENLTISDSNASSLGDILILNETSRQMVLFPDSNSNSGNSRVKKFADKSIVKANCVLCLSNDLAKIEASVQIPFVRLLPNSLFYFIVENREKKQISILKDLPDMLLDLDLMFSNKRLAELSKILEIRSRSNSESIIKNTIQKYKDLINDAIKQADKLPEVQKNDKLIKILAYLRVQSKFLRSMPNFDKISPTDSNSLSIFISDTLSNLKLNTWMTQDGENKKLIFKLNDEGEYNLIINNSPFPLIKTTIDGKDYTSQNRMWLDKGVHKLELIYQPQDNLLSEKVASSGILSLDYGEKQTFETKRFDYRKYYFIRFEYRILEGKAPNIRLVQDNDQKDWDGSTVRKINSLLNNDGKWHTFEYTLTPNLGAKTALFEFYSSGFDFSPSVFELRNFVIKESFAPQGYLVKNENLKDRSIPAITFLKINPAEYRVHVENARSPFILNFGENYNNNWKAYIVNSEDYSFRMRNLQIVANYFNGQIKELEPQNKFIDESFISTLFLSPLPEDRHLKTNGYSNGWIINEKGNYDIIIVYWPQRLVYLGAVISGASLFILLINLILIRKRNEIN